jgi:hypothetical protein
MSPSGKTKVSECSHSSDNLYIDVQSDYTLYKCKDCHAVVGGSNNKSNVLEGVYVKFRASDSRE